MIVMINGSFGVGKTTVAGLLNQALPGSAVYDPEWVGYVLRRLPPWISLKGSGTDDYQDIDLWRRCTIVGTRLFRFFVPGTIIVPMTFSNRTYFDEVVTGIKQFEPELRVFCLKASETVIKERLVSRRTPFEGTEAAWIVRRARECIAAHNNPHFGEFVDTEVRSAHEVANDIISRISRS